MSNFSLNDSSKNFNDTNNSSSLTSSILIDPGPIYQSYTIGYFFIGLGITITSSILNAFGLTLYILSQVLGSTLALQYMRSEYVAPLGSTSLIFNFLFARWLLGTQITILDTIGTLIVIIGVVGVIGFGNIRQAGIDQEANMSLSILKELWARPPWIIYLISLELITIIVLWLAIIAYEVIEEKMAVEVNRTDNEADDEQTDLENILRRGGGRRTSTLNRQSSIITKTLALIISYRNKLRNWLKSLIERWSISKPDQSLLKLDGLLWGSSAGLLAGQTLIFAKSFVKLVTDRYSDRHLNSKSNHLTHPLSVFILILLIITGVLQVWCLNRGLKVYDSTLIVPVLFAIYTASGFINSLIYLHELPNYRTWVLFMIWVCIGILVIGVCMLSAKRPESGTAQQKALGEYSSSADPEGELQHTAIGRDELVGMVIIQSQAEETQDRNRVSDIGSTRKTSTIGRASLSSTRQRRARALSSRGSTDQSNEQDRGLVVKDRLMHDQAGLTSGSKSNPFEEFELVNDELDCSGSESYLTDEIDRLDHPK
ncbi:hypothetical protein O181_033671 [Austropuccinia psidii MF-1]|uniref:Uncharacterized protein n=1 Tax=Austropuccinia psidii MF-1 TaxID=1389203 RepID=A0A9Q3D4W0_9BASI|nr:hypothetical protein [Austropuccinia psidii MF-1]